MIEIGIDPGLRGAVAVVADGYANVWDTPSAEVERGRDYLVGGMVDTLREALTLEPVHATLEGGRIVPTRIKDRRTGEYRDTHQSAKSQAAYWRGIGLWEGILAGLGIPYTVVPPATWKRAMGVTADKSEAIVIAQRLFPTCAHLLYRARDDGRAEALLLAAYGRGVRAAVAS